MMETKTKLVRINAKSSINAEPCTDEFFVDPEDYERVNKYKWYRLGGTFFAKTPKLYREYWLPESLNSVSIIQVVLSMDVTHHNGRRKNTEDPANYSKDNVYMVEKKKTSRKKLFDFPESWKPWKA